MVRRLIRTGTVGPGLTIAVAGLVGVLGIVGTISQEVVSAATLAVLATVSAELLASRRWSLAADRSLRQLAAIVDAQGSPSADRVLGYAVPGAWAADAGCARRICLVGVTLARTVRMALPELEQCLATGGTVQVAVTDPGGSPVGGEPGEELLREAARRHGLEADAEIFRHRLGTTADTLTLLSRSADGRGRLEVRFLPFVPNVSLALVDPDGPEGRCAVDVYAHQPGAHEPSLNLSRREDPRWFAHFAAEFNRIWESGRAVPVPAGLRAVAAGPEPTTGG